MYTAPLMPSCSPTESRDGFARKLTFATWLAGTTSNVPCRLEESPTRIARYWPALWTTPAQRRSFLPVAPLAGERRRSPRCREPLCRSRWSGLRRRPRREPASAGSCSRSGRGHEARWRKAHCRPQTEAGISLETTRTVCRHDGAFAADLPCNVGGKRYGKRGGSLGQEGTVHIMVRNPDQLSVLVIERPQNVRDVHHLAALIHQLSCQGCSGRRIQLLIFDRDHRVRRCRDQ